MCFLFSSLCQPFLTHYNPVHPVPTAPFAAVHGSFKFHEGNPRKEGIWIENGDVYSYRSLLPDVTSVFGRQLNQVILKSYTGYKRLDSLRSRTWDVGPSAKGESR